MFRHHFDQADDSNVVWHWFLLSFNGGCINAGGFLASGRFVSHVTGFATLFGVESSNGHHDVALGLLSVPFFFLLGAFTVGILVDRRLSQDKRPRFDLVMALSSILLFMAATGGSLFHVGDFGNSLGLKDSYILMVLLCLASGLQNGAITSSSGRSVRTTHLTGLTTDLGIGLARIISLKHNQSSFQKELRANYLRLGSIAAFVLGSAVGAWFFFHLGYHGFVIPGLISAYAAWLAYRS